jgi:hypothetical protein
MGEWMMAGGREARNSEGMI